MRWFNNRVGRKRKRYVFIVTYGRSGSTLLMNILNTADHCLIRGENNNALYYLYRSYKAIADAKTHNSHNAHNQTSAWWGIADVDSQKYRSGLINLFVETVLRPGTQDTVLGFKEIRFSKEDIPDLPEYIDFLLSAFPGSKIIVNHRNLHDVANSKWWKNNSDSKVRLEDTERRLSGLSDSERIFHFSYDRALIDLMQIKLLFSWLHLPFDERRIEKVLDIKHSY